MQINRQAVQFGKIYTEDYGPYDDAKRLQVALMAKELGVIRTASTCGVSESSVRNWARAYQVGPVHSTEKRD